MNTMSHVPIRTPPMFIEHGTVVVLKNLRREELNGMFGAIEGHQAGGRFIVDVANRGKMAIKYENVDFVASTSGWCHSCASEVSAKFTRIGELQCQRCGSNFIESSASEDYSEAPSFSPPQQQRPEHERAARAQPNMSNMFNIFQNFGMGIPFGVAPTRMMPGMMPGMMFGGGLNFEDMFGDDILHRLHEMNEPRGPPPASEAAVANLKQEVLEHDDESNPCAVCQDKQCSGDTVTTMPCGHVFHSDCLSPWLKEHNTCPTCRHGLPTNDPEYNMQQQLGTPQEK